MGKQTENETKEKVNKEAKAANGPKDGPKDGSKDGSKKKPENKLKKKLDEIRKLDLKHRIKHSRLVHNLRTNKKMRRAVIAAVIAMLLFIAYLIYKDIQYNNRFNVGDANYISKSSTITYNGKEYSYNSSISTILLIGIDSEGPMTVSKDYGDQARADNIDLIIFDKLNKTIKLLPISRDTMTEVSMFSSKGYETGKITTHLGFAYSFGNGGKASSMNVCTAVSDLLYGAEVYRYVTTNIDSIGYANSLIGGVTVTVPNNDLAFRYPEMTQGAQVKLTDDNVADFLRYRDTGVEGSNNGRMERQRAFLEAYIKKLETLSKSDYTEMWNKLSKDKSKIRTNMTRSQFMTLISNVKNYEYDPAKHNLKIEGTNAMEGGYDVFYPDQAKLKKLVIDTFYTE